MTMTVTKMGRPLLNPKDKQVLFSFRLHPRELRGLRAFARRNGVTPSEVIREALSEYFAKR
jgi:hypothetical protein